MQNTFIVLTATSIIAYFSKLSHNSHMLIWVFGNLLFPPSLGVYAILQTRKCVVSFCVIFISVCNHLKKLEFILTNQEKEKQQTKFCLEKRLFMAWEFLSYRSLNLWLYLQVHALMVICLQHCKWSSNSHGRSNCEMVR